jgi:lysyl-tRNA synthetase class 2
MLEWYRAFSGMLDVLADTEQVVASVVRELRGTRSVQIRGASVDVTPPFERVTVREAFKDYAGVADAADLAASDPDRYFDVLVGSVEPGLARLPRAVALTEFPITQAALARPCPHDPTVAERFEVYVGGVELCNGFGELTDPIEQRRRFEREYERRRRTGAPLHPIDEPFLAALAEGLPPSGGNALGFDRLVALALSAEKLQDVIAFPK